MEPSYSSEASHCTHKKAMPSPNCSISCPDMKAASVNLMCTPEKPALDLGRALLHESTLSVKELQQTEVEPICPEHGVAASDDSTFLFVEKTAEKSSVATLVEIPSPSKIKASVTLPEKYQMLCELFNSMDTSIRLLRMKGSKATFPNIRACVQHLTQWNLTYRHVAQLKYILPEAIAIKRVLLPDATTCCMQPELQISLHVDGLEDSMECIGESKYSVLRKLFRERVVDFHERHPEEDDIYEDELPHPFNQAKWNIPLNTKIMSTPAEFEPSNASSFQRQFALFSHLPPLRRHFLQRVQSTQTNECDTCKGDKASSPSLSPSEFSSLGIENPTLGSPKVCNHIVELTSMSADDEPKASKDCALDSPHGKVVSSPRLITITPKPQTPDRFCTEIGCNSTSSKRSARTKLFANPEKNIVAQEELGGSSHLLSADGTNDNDAGLLPKSLKSVIVSLHEKGAVGIIRRKMLIACLRNHTFSTILSIYRSKKCSAITKRELVYRIISSDLTIDDPVEVEEQLQLLKEVAPDWFYEKTSSLSGLTLCCIDVHSDPEAIRKRLYPA